MPRKARNENDTHYLLQMPKALHRDAMAYCKERDLNLSQLIRHLLRTEIYYKEVQQEDGNRKG